MKKETRERFIEVFNKIYKKVYGGQKPPLCDNVAFTDFEREFDKLYSISVGEDLIVDYVVYHFNRTNQQKAPKPQPMQSNWVFGRTAVVKWLERSPNYKIWNQTFIRENNLRVHKKSVPNKELIHQLSKELEEKRNLYSNTTSGYVHCTINDLYSKYSETCKNCNFKSNCEL